MANVSVSIDTERSIVKTEVQTEIPPSDGSALPHSHSQSNLNNNNNNKKQHTSHQKMFIGFRKIYHRTEKFYSLHLRQEWPSPRRTAECSGWDPESRPWVKPCSAHLQFIISKAFHNRKNVSRTLGNMEPQWPVFPSKAEEETNDQLTDFWRFLLLKPKGQADTRANLWGEAESEHSCLTLAGNGLQI